MNPTPALTSSAAAGRSEPTDALLHWAVLIAKAAALGFVDHDCDAQRALPCIGFRTIPAATGDRDLAVVEQPRSPIAPPATKGPIR